MNQSELANSTEFSSPSVPGFSVSVNGNEAFIVTNNSVSFGDGISQAYTQSQIRTLIGVMLDVHEEMEIEDEEKEDNQMSLFSENDMNDIHDEFEMNELVSNATSFLMMQEDFSNDIISKEDMMGALSILQNSIENYLAEVERSDDSAKNEEVFGESDPTEMSANFEEPDQPRELDEFKDFNYDVFVRPDEDTSEF